MAGRHYPFQEYEGGITGALSLAILQELNGRNTANPISRMQVEKPFRKKTDAWVGPDKKPRYLRADLHVNLAGLRIGTPLLAAYGWRHSNWLEAKFFRSYDEKGKPKKSSNQVVNMGDLLADVVRLLALVPIEIGKTGTYSGRYLLHVYSAEVGHHLSLKRELEDKKDVDREWIKAITQPGPQELLDFSVGTEIEGVVARLNESLKDVHVSMSVFNHVLRPTHAVPGAVSFICILTRVNQFKVAWGNHFWGVKEDRTVQQSGDDAYKQISDHIGRHIKTKGVSEDRPPLDKEADVVVPEEEDGAEEVEVEA